MDCIGYSCSIKFSCIVNLCWDTDQVYSSTFKTTDGVIRYPCSLRSPNCNQSFFLTQLLLHRLTRSSLLLFLTSLSCFLIQLNGAWPETAFSGPDPIILVSQLFNTVTKCWTNPTYRGKDLFWPLFYAAGTFVLSLRWWIWVVESLVWRELPISQMMSQTEKDENGDHNISK